MNTLRTLALAALCAGAAHAASPLAGSWNVARLVSDGKDAPAAVTATLQLTVTGDAYALTQNGVALESGTLVTDKTTVDLTITAGGDRGKVQHGLYRLDGDALILTKFAAGQDGRPADLDAKPGQTRLELTRVPPPLPAK